MRKTMSAILGWAAAGVLIAFAVIVTNQTIQIVNFAATIDADLGRAVLGVLLGLYALCIAVPIILVLRMPKPLNPPDVDTGPEFQLHLSRLRKRFAANPRLKGVELEGREGVEQAIEILSREADGVSTQSAKHVFIATAILQNGDLDGLVTLAVQSRMIWQIAHIYFQRPPVRELLQLYANVAMTAFVAAELQDLDISDQMEPLISSALGSMVGAIPGARAAASLLVESGLTGAANAFLTLRVGMIAKRYCGALVHEKRGLMRRSASAEAAKALGGVVSSGMKKVAGAVAKAAQKKVTSPITDTVGRTKRTLAGFVKRGEETLEEGEESDA